MSTLHTSPLHRAWSPAHIDRIEIGALSLLRATVWRRAHGFAEQKAPKTLHDSDLINVSEWLLTSPTPVSLRIACELGGTRPSTSWLGLSVIQPDPTASLQPLAEAAADLGETLDAWDFFPVVPRRGPHLPRPLLALTLDRPEDPALLPVSYPLERVVRVLRDHSERCTWVLEIEPPPSPPEDTAPIFALWNRLPPIPNLAPQERREGPYAVQSDLHALWLQHASPSLRLTVHGASLAPTMRDAAAHALSGSLGRAASLEPAKPFALRRDAAAVELIALALETGSPRHTSD